MKLTDKTKLFKLYLANTGIFAESFQEEAAFKFGIASALLAAGEDAVLKELHDIELYESRKIGRPRSLPEVNRFVDEFICR